MDFAVDVYQDGYLNITIHNVTGAVIMEVLKDYYIEAGTLQPITLNVETFPSGSYMIQVSMSDDNNIQQFIIVK